jgi:hypothetical protein
VGNPRLSGGFHSVAKRSRFVDAVASPSPLIPMPLSPASSFATDMVASNCLQVAIRSEASGLLPTRESKRGANLLDRMGTEGGMLVLLSIHQAAPIPHGFPRKET